MKARLWMVTSFLDAMVTLCIRALPENIARIIDGPYCIMLYPTTKVSFEKALNVKSISIYETFHGGAVTKVSLKNPAGEWIEVYSGVANDITESRIFKPTLQVRSFKYPEQRVILLAILWLYIPCQRGILVWIGHNSVFHFNAVTSNTDIFISIDVAGIIWNDHYTFNPNISGYYVRY